MKMAGTLIVALFLVIGCSKDDEQTEVVQPTNLVITAEVGANGAVSVTASAENTNYFMIYFGEDPSEIPLKSANGVATHTYQESGTYTLRVAAHATETDKIERTQEVTVTKQVAGGTDLVWSDEFDGTSLNSANWVFETGAGGWGNNELQYYRQENVTVTGGFLTITAKQENFSGSNFTSSRIITKGKKEVEYGKIEIRAKLPQGQGIWPALWMLGADISSVGWPKCGEIDIMEMIGGNNREKTVYGTLHWDDNGHVCTCDKPGYTLSSGKFSDDFHVFSIEWTSSEIKWLIDGTQFNQINITPAGLSEFHNKYFLIFNVAVGGNWPGNPDNTTTFPQQMIVDYVRVYQ